METFSRGSDPIVIFAANPEDRNHRLTITWPDGRETQIDSIQANRIYEIQESESQRVEKESDTADVTRSPVFEDVSNRISHQHYENEFEDFQLQPLLPVSMSKLGPGILWIDIDKDQDDDLLIGSGMGGTAGVFEDVGDGSFSPVSQGFFSKNAAGDHTAIVGWENASGTNLLVGSANYEQGQLRVPSAYQYQIDEMNTTQPDSLTGNISTTGPLSAADYDNDGDVDLFVGGRFIPGHYPMDTPSRFYTNENGSFVIDKVNSRKLQQVGLVTGSLFTDIDLDGDQDLVLSREWDSILLLENDGGIFNQRIPRWLCLGVKRKV